MRNKVLSLSKKALYHMYQQKGLLIRSLTTVYIILTYYFKIQSKQQVCKYHFFIDKTKVSYTVNSLTNVSAVTF